MIIYIFTLQISRYMVLSEMTLLLRWHLDLFFQDVPTYSEKKESRYFPFWEINLRKHIKFNPKYYWLIYIIFVYFDSECLSQYTFKCNIFISFIAGKTLIFFRVIFITLWLGLILQEMQSTLICAILTFYYGSHPFWKRIYSSFKIYGIPLQLLSKRKISQVAINSLTDSLWN